MKVLTKTVLKKFTPRKNRYESCINGLRIWVSPSGRIGFGIKIQRCGERVTKKIGAFPSNKLNQSQIDQINQRWNQFHLDLKTETKPQHANSKLSVGKVFDLFMESKQSHCKTSTIEAYIHRFGQTKGLGDQRVSEVTKADLLASVSHIKARASRQSSLITLRNLLRWAHQNDFIHSNPWVGMAHMRHNKRSRVLERSEIVALWPHLYPVHRFLLLTAQRVGEVRTMQWKDLSFYDGLIKWKQSQNKTDTPHILTLPPLAVAQLPDTTERSGVVFRGRYRNKPYTTVTGIWKPINETYKKLGIEDATCHDFRRTALTNIAELMQSGEIAERVANHALSGIASRYNLYTFEEPKAKALARWAKRIEDWIF